MKKLMATIALTVLLLAACGGSPVPTATPLPPTTTPPPPTNTPLAPTATSAPAPTVIAAPTPEATATETSLFPPVTDADWQTGPADARVTIVEYGDYQ